MGEPWDTPELQAMLADMLNPPEVVDDDVQARDESMAAERNDGGRRRVARHGSTAISPKVPARRLVHAATLLGVHLFVCQKHIV